MVSSYVKKNGKFILITNRNQIKSGDIVDLYANGINNYYAIHSLLPNYANNWINNSTINSSGIMSYRLLNNNNIRPYFEYRDEVIGWFLGWVGHTIHNWGGGIGREWHNTTQEIVKHPLVLAIPAALIAAPFLIPALGAALGTAAGAVGAGFGSVAGAVSGAVGTGLSAVEGAVSAVGSAVAPIVSDVESFASPFVSAGEKILSPIEKFGAGVFKDILPSVGTKAVGGAAPTLLSDVEGSAEGLVGDVAKTVGTGLAVSLASKLLGHNSQHQILYDGAVDSGYNPQQAQSYSNQYQSSLSKYAGDNNISSNDAMSQTAAYVYAHLRDYIAHGYKTAQQAIFYTLKKTRGIPPNANTPISSILGSSNSIDKYIPFVLIGGAGILLISLMDKNKNKSKMEMANG